MKSTLTYNQCIILPTNQLKKLADQSKIAYITLDKQADRYNVCKQLSLHQQPLITNNKLNSDLSSKLKQYQNKTSSCKSTCKP